MMVRQLLLAVAMAAAARAQTTPGAPPPPAARKSAPKPPAAGAGRGNSGPSYKDLKYSPLRPMETPQVARFQLPNGMKVVFLEDHERPAVTVQAIVRTGSVFDPADRAGLATLTGMVIRSGGSRRKTPDQLDLELEGQGATIDSSIAETMATVSLSALKENLPLSLALFRDVLTAPDFRLDRIARARSVLSDAIARRNDDPRGALRRELGALVYGKESPYTRRMEYATLGRITRADIDAFYRRYFFPANISLAISGDFDAADLKVTLTSLFADWKTAQPPVPAFPKDPAVDSAGGYIAFRRDLRETYFGVGRQLGELNDKDSAAVDIAAAILGGSPQSRLHLQARAAGGSSPDLEADWTPAGAHAGLFAVTGSNESVATGDIAQAILREIERLRASEVTDDELRIGRETALLRLARGLDNRRRKLLAIAGNEYYGRPADYYEQYQKTLAAVTRADVLRVAKERLDPQKFTVVAVSNLTVFTKPLDPRGGASQTIDLTIRPPKLSEAAGSDTASLELGKRLLERAQQASGGVEKLAAIKDMSQSIAHVLQAGGQAHETDRWIAPSYLRQEGSSPINGTIIRYTDGKGGWASNGRASIALLGASLQRTLSDLLRVQIPLLLSDRIPGRTVNALDDHTIEIVEGSQIARVVLDPETGLPATLLYEAENDKGPPVSYQEDLSDYRDVDGIKLPFGIRTIEGGTPYAEGVVTEYKLNQGLKPEVLQRRP